jgi:hypothetical protein
MMLSEYFAGNMADGLMSTEPALLEKAAFWGCPDSGPSAVYG